MDEKVSEFIDWVEIEYRNYRLGRYSASVALDNIYAHLVGLMEKEEENE